MSWRDDLHNEMNPDMRSFGSKGTSSVNPHDEAELKGREEADEARSNALENAQDRARDNSNDDDDMSEEDILDSMHRPEI